MAASISVISNANLYLDGVSFLGRASEVKLPEIKAKMLDVNALGMFSSIQVPVGLDKLEATLTMNGLYDDMVAVAADPFTSVLIMVRGTIEKFEGPGRTSQVPVVCHLQGTFSTNPMGSFKPHEKSDLQYQMSITACKCEIDGAVVYDIDVFANKFTVDGSDVLETYRANLGL